jgi:hypothetical protein
MVISPIAAVRTRSLNHEFHSQLFTQPHCGLFELRLPCLLSGAFEGLRRDAKPGLQPRAGVRRGWLGEACTGVAG